MTLIIIHQRTHTEIECPCSLADTHKCFGDDDCCYLSANYLKGKDKPNYPVPAIKYEAVWGEEEFWNTVLILKHDHCLDAPLLEAICDFNWDRCMDFETPHGEFYSVHRERV